MCIPTGTRLYSCPTRFLTCKVCVLLMGIKVCPYPVHASMVPLGIRTVGKIAILNTNNHDLPHLINQPCSCMVAENSTTRLKHTNKTFRKLNSPSNFIDIHSLRMKQCMKQCDIQTTKQSIELQREKLGQKIIYSFKWQ
jgi:hypothetical protein